jgi:hypothetical protein
MFTPLSHCELGLCGLDFLLGFEINEGNYIAALLCLLHVNLFREVSVLCLSRVFTDGQIDRGAVTIPLDIS